MLTQLGSKVPLPKSPEEAVIEAIEVKDEEIRKADIRYECPEFTSLCPITGQPDFARIYIDVIPKNYLPESKSLKLFLGSFRNHGAFHEPTTVMIGTRLRDVLRPKWIRVAGIWYARGGIAIDVFWEDGNKGTTYVPPLKAKTYEGR